MRGIIRDESNVEKDNAGVNRKENSFPLGQRILRRQCLAAERRERNCGGGLQSAYQLAAGNSIMSVRSGGGRGEEATAAAAEMETRAELRGQGSNNRRREVLKSRHGLQLELELEVKVMMCLSLSLSL